MEALEQKTNKKPPNSGVTRVCFVCTGNTCRSPMAEEVLNKLGGGAYFAVSAGISAFENMPMSNEAAVALEKAGITTSGFHLARNLTEQDLVDNDLIVAITGAHAGIIMRAFPMYASKITTFSEDVPDPYGMGQEAYDRCLEKIISLIKNKFTLPQGDSNGTQIR